MVLLSFLVYRVRLLLVSQKQGYARLRARAKRKCIIERVS